MFTRQLMQAAPIAAHTRVAATRAWPSTTPIIRRSLATSRPNTSRASFRQHPPPPPQMHDVTPDTTRRNAIIAGILLSAALGAWYYETTTMGAYSKEPEFSVTVGRGAKTWSFPRKPMAELEQMMHQHEKTTSPGRKGNPVLRWDTNYVASNEPCEDRSAADVVPRGPARKSWWSWGAAPAENTDAVGSRDLVLVSVVDGHAGDATSKLLERTLHPTLALALAGLQAGIVPGASWYSNLADTLTWAKTWSPSNVAKTLQNAYVQLDDNICHEPIKMLPELLKTDDIVKTVETRHKFVALTEPASHGAVAASALVDAENKGLYVAVAGDCRAVAGWQRPDGSWRCDTLTEDQMGDNPKEVARMRSEHPVHEADTVIRNGRVQGGLQPTRAFGDAVYKWTTLQGEAIAAVFKDEGAKPRSIRPWNFTPPYVTARPEVTYRSLEGEDKLRFVVLATDGLWDRITSEEAALLVAGYLAHPKAEPISKEGLATEIPLALTEPRPYPVEALPGTGKRAKGTWAFDGDKNAATHLIRNAFGGADRKEFQELLSLHGPAARYFRDDMTVTVVLFDDEGKSSN